MKILKKNYFNILTIFVLFQSLTYAYDRYYIQQSPYPNYNSYGYCHPYCILNRTPYNPYWVQKRVNYSSNTNTKAKRLKRVRRLQKLREYSNRLSWFKPSGQGSLTGYSVPVTKDIYNQMGISPYNPKNKTRVNSPTCNQELFSTPQGNEMYYKDGQRYTDLKGSSGKTGVTIIYD